MCFIVRQSDLGVILLRKLYTEQMNVVAAGGDPLVRVEQSAGQRRGAIEGGFEPVHRDDVHTHGDNGCPTGDPGNDHACRAYSTVTDLARLRGLSMS